MPKSKPQVVTPALPGIDGPGVSALSIPEIDKAISKYERKKDARCQVSPGEVEAKRELTALLRKHSGELPKNGDGQRFYRAENVDYILTEKLMRKRVDDGSEDGED